MIAKAVNWNQVASALSFDEADRVLAAQPEAICALVTDVDLGDGLIGWVLAKRARQAVPRLPVVYASGGGGHDLATQGVAGSRFVGKPYAPDQLARVACALLADA